MNTCYFIGFFSEKPHLDKMSGVSYTHFELEIITFRKTKAGEKVKTVTYLPFEAYHTGAETITKIAQPGSKIAVQCSAKTWKDNEGYESVIFRINEFDFSCQEEINNEEKNTFLR